ncbi:MAG: DNA primase, partial [Hymenobacter sp.]
EGQIRLIKRYTDNVTVLYDGDAAGIKASLRGIDLLLEGGLNVRVVLFPDGDDPDSYIRKVGDQRFATYIDEQSQDFIAFKTTLVAREASHDPVKKAEAIREVLQSIAKVPDGLKRQVFLQQTASVFGFDEQVIITEYNKLLKTSSPAKARPEENRGSSMRSPATATVPTASSQSVMSDEEIEMAMYGVPSDIQGVISLSNDSTNPALESKPMDALQDCERAVLRLLVLYGPHELQEGLSVALYLLSQLEDTVIHTPLFASLWEEYRIGLHRGILPEMRQLIQNPDAAVRKLLADFATEIEEPSANWRIKEIYIPSELSFIHLLCDRAIMRLNLYHAEVELRRIDRLLHAPGLSNQEADNILVSQIQTKKIVVELGKRLGTVVPRSIG